FFFQAEDGIRDLIVTGVQTCALPIWRYRRAAAAAAPTASADSRARDPPESRSTCSVADMMSRRGQLVEPDGPCGCLRPLEVVLRSEERRVGGECVSLAWWGACVEGRV